MSNIPYNYHKYIDDVTKMTQRGHISSGEQEQSPSSAGSRGLAKTQQFTNNPTQMKLGESITMEDMKSLISRIDGLNAPTNEGPKQDQAKVMMHLEGLRDMIMELEMDDDAKTSAITALDQVADDISMEESYEPFPEEDEMTFEDDDAFYEAFGELGFPEDENELFDAEYRGRKVPLNKPMRGDVKKFKVYVKDPKSGNVKKVNFGHGGSSARKAGQKTMKIRKSNPKARKSFRARHNCANPGPKTKARYWSCRKW